MDVNGTRFHMLLGESNWSNCTSLDGSPVRSISTDSPVKSPDFSWDEHKNELMLQPEVFLFTQQTTPQHPLDIDKDRRGVGVDQFKNIYWIDESKNELKVLSSGSGEVSHFWSSEDGKQCASQSGEFLPSRSSSTVAPLTLSGLTVTHDHYLVVGVQEPKGILVFDLYTPGNPRQWLWPVDVDFSPFDIEARPQGGVWILDRLHRRVWELNRLFNIISHNASPPTETKTDFHPLDIEKSTTTKSIITPELSVDMSLLLTTDNPLAIAALSNDSFLILQQPATDEFSQIAHYRFDTGLLETVSTDVMVDHLGTQNSFVLRAYDFVSISDNEVLGSSATTLYIIDADGNQSFKFNYQIDSDGVPKLDAEADFLPMRFFAGKGLASLKNQPYYDFGSGWIPLKEQRRPQYPEQANLITKIFDGRETDCIWHRFLIDAVIPPDCQVQIYSRAANDLTQLSDSQTVLKWDKEPLLYRRENGSEIAYEPTPKRNNEGTWELLFQKLYGRYAQIKISIISDQRSTPRFRAMRVYYPRFSYLNNYLPAVYREDVNSASFLDRFLANFEGNYTSLEERIAAVQMLFDVRSVPADSLPWLAEWLGVVLDPAWDENRRRLLLQNAMYFYQWRGTRPGLKMALRLALDDCVTDEIFDISQQENELSHGIRILEKFQMRQQGGQWRLQQGVRVLHNQYQQVIDSNTPDQLYPLIKPKDNSAQAWQDFSKKMLGFVPQAWEEQVRWQHYLCTNYPDVEALNLAYGTSYKQMDELPMPQDLPSNSIALEDWNLFQSQGHGKYQSLLVLWHGYLNRRYSRVQEFNNLYGTVWRNFKEIAYPAELPGSETALKDWFEFESTILSMHRGAHRFDVYLPLFKQDYNAGLREQRRELARRIIEIEKPAHTAFDVNYYWALFLIGTARIGHDTHLDIGSRAPQLAVAANVNQAHLGSSYLANNFPVQGARNLLGEDALQQRTESGRLNS